jgi:hypothetical protein
LDLGEQDARLLAKAYADVAAIYPILALDPKIAAVANLGSTIAVIGFARYTAYKFRRHNERGQRTAQTVPRPAAQPTPAPPTEPPPNAFDQQINGVDYNAKKQAQDLPPAIRTGIVPGIGNIEFPADHELVRGNRKH